MAFALGKLAPERLDAAHDHLDACTACQCILTEAAHALGTAVTAKGSSAAGEDEFDWNTTFQRGTLVGGRYEIREFIARGGMGEVYEAFDRELHERVALKAVSATACDSLRAVKRLKGEVQLARRVSHPNVCRIYDFGTHTLGTTGTPIYFLTMEFVEGETLGQRVRLAGAVPEREARKIARELLLGLGAAHEAGVLHRDFKGDNVMLKVEPDGTASAVILDFGLARAADSRDGASGSNSQLVGTFGYIAPERLDGRPYTATSDVYAFGVVWFEMLTGELPYRASGTGPISSPRRIEHAVAPSRLNPSVPPGIDALVLRCLERSPSARFRSVAEILQALDAFEASQSPSWGRRALGLVLAACMAAAALYLFAVRPTHAAPEKAAALGPGAAVEAPRPITALPRSLPPAPRIAPAASVLAPPPLRSAASTLVAPANGLAPRSRPPRPTHSEAKVLAPALEPIEPLTPPPAPLTPPSSASVPPLDPPSRSFTEPSAHSPARPPAPDWENPFKAKAAVPRARTTSDL